MSHPYPDLLIDSIHIQRELFILSLQDTNVQFPGLAERWQKSFKIPNRESFSGSVQAAIDSGVVSSRARREIVQTLRTLMLQHTKYPTSDQYNAVCILLVEKFEKLKDSLGSGYVSELCSSHVSAHPAYSAYFVAVPRQPVW